MNIFQPDGVATTNPVTLLTIPRDEMEQQNGTPMLSLSAPSFVLLQIPLNCTVDDFINNTSDKNTSPNTYFVATRHNHETQQTPAPAQQQQDAVCCVIECKGCSYTVHRIETSNTLIVVPPPTPSETTQPLSATECIDDTADDNNVHQQPSKFTRVLSAHLIQKPNTSTATKVTGGGSNGSYFLELRRKHLRLSDLRHALFVLDPYNDSYIHGTNHRTRNGQTIHDLAMSLQVSQHEIQQGLHHIGAYAIPSSVSGSGNSTKQRYCLLDDHVMNDCNSAIVTGLYTMSDCTDDYGGANGIINIDPLMFVKNIVHHVQRPEDETIANIESIFLHCLQMLNKDPELSNGKFILDVSKVAVCIVRRLFLKRTVPYLEKELLTIWQSELPGVGPIYQVSTAMLRRIAICTGDMDEAMMSSSTTGIDDPTVTTSWSSEDRQWHYLPVESMSMDAQKCFDVLYQIKDRYTMYELEPYLEHLIDTLPSDMSLSSSMTELLLRYTKLTTQIGPDGISRTFYEQK